LTVFCSRWSEFLGELVVGIDLGPADPIYVVGIVALVGSGHRDLIDAVWHISLLFYTYEPDLELLGAMTRPHSGILLTTVDQFAEVKLLKLIYLLPRIVVVLVVQTNSEHDVRCVVDSEAVFLLFSDSYSC
jgi:hypothetical protein